MTYESAKQILTTLSGSNHASPGPVLISGGLCGIVSWAMICEFLPRATCLRRNG